VSARVDREELRRALAKMDAAQAALSELQCNHRGELGYRRRAEHASDALGRARRNWRELCDAAARELLGQRPASAEEIDSWDASELGGEWTDAHAYHAGFTLGWRVAEERLGLGDLMDLIRIDERHRAGIAPDDEEGG
jgi:hypothetical protein